MMRWKITAVLLLLLWPASLLAVSSSPNYKIDEDFIGTGGLIEEGSTNFKAHESIGDIGIGDSASTNFQTKSGYTTTNDPALSFSVSGSANLGALSISVARTGNATFQVLNYTSYGYIVQIKGGSLAIPTHTIAPLATPTASAPGSEQFGINLAANTSPASFGADPVQVPDNSFSYGAASSDYATANLYKYVDGDTIAQATKSSGRTDYTISFIANISFNTDAGAYSTAQTLICVGTY